MLTTKKNRYILVGSSLLLVGLLLYAVLRDNTKILNYETFVKIVRSGDVKKAQISEEYFYLFAEDAKYKIAKELVATNDIKDIPIEVRSSTNYLLPLVILCIALGVGGVLFRLYRKKQQASEEKKQSSTATGTSKEEENVHIHSMHSNTLFKDVGGISDVKVELEEIVDYLKNPKKYKEFGIKLPKGTILAGPPGVGKTLMAKAVAGEAGVPFYYQSGASFVQIYVGMGAKRVRELFREAKRNAPSIIFIDEIDAVGKARGGNRNDEREATLNQLLTEMDGFEDSSGVIVLAATNKIEMLDSALLRAGRFDRRIFVSLPTPKERTSILQKHLQNMSHSVDAEKVAAATTGFSGALLATLVNEAALIALKRGATEVSTEDLLAVKDKVQLGKKRLQTLSVEQKEVQAHYVVAKALFAISAGIGFEKVSLLNHDITVRNKKILSRESLQEAITLHLCGMAASQHFYETHFSNVEDDVKEAKRMAQELISKYAMTYSFFAKENEIEELLQELLAQAKRFVNRNEEGIKHLATLLLENENLEREIILKSVDEIL